MLDLSGYHREHVGTGYELQRVVDRFRSSGVLMLASRASDQRFLEAQVACRVVADGGGFAERRSGAPVRADRPL